MKYQNDEALQHLLFIIISTYKLFPEREQLTIAIVLGLQGLRIEKNLKNGSALQLFHLIKFHYPPQNFVYIANHFEWLDVFYCI